MANDKTIVTLVHGTFANDARWIQSESELSKALLSAGCQPEPFAWPGGNSHIARIKAADELAGRLGKRPGAAQYVIAHSHGGNVALQALQRLRQEGISIERIRIISLATPFICAAHRPVARIVLGQSVSGGIIAIYLTALGSSSPAPRNTWAWSIGLVIALGFVLQLILLAGAAKAHGRLYRKPVQMALLEAINSPRVSYRDLLVIRAAGDEASGLLVSGQFVSWITTQLLELFRPHRWRTVGGIAGLIAAVVALLANDGIFQDTVLLAVGATFTFLIVLSIAVGLALFFASLTYGFDGPAVGLFAFVSAEATPPGTPQLIQLGSRSRMQAVGLAHSSLYNDPEVIGKIIEHIYQGRST